MQGFILCSYYIVPAHIFIFMKHFGLMCMFYCRLFQSDFHFSRRSRECDEVSSRHEPPEGYRPRARHSVDWSLCGQCCKCVTVLYFSLKHCDDFLRVLKLLLHILYVQCHVFYRKWIKSYSIMQASNWPPLNTTFVKCIMSAASHYYIIHIIFYFVHPCTVSVHMCMSAVSSLLFTLLEWFLIMSFINLHGLPLMYICVHSQCRMCKEFQSLILFFLNSFPRRIR